MKGKYFIIYAADARQAAIGDDCSRWIRSRWLPIIQLIQFILLSPAIYSQTTALWPAANYFEYFD